MDKKEALTMFLKISHECSKHNLRNCSDCPFSEVFDGKKLCIFNHVESDFVAIVVKAKLDSMGEKQEESSVPPKNVEVKTTFYAKASIPAEELDRRIKELLPNRLTLEPLPKENRPIKMPESSKRDNVNHPNHYCKGGLECIQVIKAELTPEQYKGYLYGNVLKYMWRYRDKDGIKDLQKAKHYLEWLIESFEG